MLESLRDGRVHSLNEACIDVDPGFSPNSWLIFALGLHRDGLIYHYWPTGSLEITQRRIDYLDQVEAAK